jgi:hypothetical protein
MHYPSSVFLGIEEMHHLRQEKIDQVVAVFQQAPVFGRCIGL